MTRGEIWTIAGGTDYAGKPRPAVVLQSDNYDHLESVVVCLFTSDKARAPFVRIPVFPSLDNGLKRPCWLMVDKISTMPRTKLGSRIGVLDTPTLNELSQAIITFLNLSGEIRPHTRRR